MTGIYPAEVGSPSPYLREECALREGLGYNVLLQSHSAPFLNIQAQTHSTRVGQMHTPRPGALNIYISEMKHDVHSLTAPSLRICYRCQVHDVDASRTQGSSMLMTKVLLGTLLASLSALLLALLLASPTLAFGGPTLRGSLSGANETPPNNTGGTGFATVTLNPGHETIC